MLAEVFQITEISKWVAIPLLIVLFGGGLGFGLRWILRAPER